LRDDKKIAEHVFEIIRPEFSKKVKKGDIIVAGKNFGSGSSREEAVNTLKTLGIEIVIAESFARIYFRNLINLGIPGLKIKNVKEKFSEGDYLKISLNNGVIINETKNTTFKIDQLPQFLLEIIEAGGILNKIKQRLKNQH
jgi:3-isopropylmalate/(R)-2-methylmalate dehydratase small subunit